MNINQKSIAIAKYLYLQIIEEIKQANYKMYMKKKISVSKFKKIYILFTNQTLFEFSTSVIKIFSNYLLYYILPNYNKD